MAELETRVREALIEQRANELVAYVSENPEYMKSMATELTEIMVDAMVHSMTSAIGYFNEEEIAKLKQECMEETLPQIQAQYDNPEQVRQMMYEGAKHQYASVRQLRVQLNSFYAQMRQDGKIGEDALAEFGKVYEGLFEFVRTNDRIVRKLTKVAETEGIDKAIQKETRYAVIREMFPTSEEYRAFVQGAEEAVKNSWQQAQSALGADGETGQIIGGMLGAMGKVMEKAGEMTKKINGNYLEKTIQEIYG